MVVIREPVGADAEAIAHVHVSAWRAGYVGQLPAAYLEAAGANIPDRIKYWRSAIARSTDGLLVASFADETADADADGADGVIGFCAFGEPRDNDVPDGTGELYMINLDPSGWSTGAASALFSAAVGRLARRYRSAYLWVLDTNVRAQRFYAKHGWSFDGVTKAAEIGGAEVTELRFCSDL